MLKIKAIYIYFCTFIGKNDYKLVRKCRISGQEYILKLSKHLLHIYNRSKELMYTHRKYV